MKHEHLWQELEIIAGHSDDVKFEKLTELLVLKEGSRANVHVVEVMFEPRNAIFSYSGSMQRAQSLFWDMPRGNWLVEDAYQKYVEQRNKGENACSYQHICTSEDGLAAFKHFAEDSCEQELIDVTTMELDKVAQGLRAIVQGRREYAVNWNPVCLSFRRRYSKSYSLVLLLPEKENVRLDYRGPMQETWDIFAKPEPNIIVTNMFEDYIEDYTAGLKNFHYSSLCSQEEGVAAFHYVVNGLVSHFVN